MHSSDLWNENDLLRAKLRDLQAEVTREREERLKLKAENLWLKKLIQERALERSPEAIAEKMVADQVVERLTGRIVERSLSLVTRSSDDGSR